MQDETTAANLERWEREVQKRGGHTVPWLDLSVDLLRRRQGSGFGAALGSTGRPQ
jgi:hypothetical protein